MRTLLVMCFIVALAAPLYAESYSWVDDSGGFHFTDDYSRIPKKYRKKVKLRGDMSAEQMQTDAAATHDSTGTGGTSKTGAAGEKTATNSDGSSQRLYDGKTEDAWRSEVASKEQELRRLGESLESLQKQAAGPGMLHDRFNDLKKEYNETRETYNKKSQEYYKTLEAAKKAGLPVEMRK